MDPREIAELLHIHKEAAGHGGSLNKIAGAAMNRLKQINDQITPDAYMAEQEPGADGQNVIEPEPVPERNVVPHSVPTEVDGEGNPTIVTEPTAEQIEAERVKQASIPRRDLGATKEPSNG